MTGVIFEGVPQASAVAGALRGLDFSAGVYVHGSNDFAERTREFCSGNPLQFEPKACRVSGAGPEWFPRIAQRHYGFIVPGCL